MRKLGLLWLAMLVVGAFCQAQHLDDDDFDGFDGDVYDDQTLNNHAKIDWAQQPAEPLQTEKPSADAPPFDKIEILQLETPVYLNDPLRGYHWETFIIVLCVFYVAFYMFGRVQNESMAEEWMRNSLPLLKEEFALVGEGEDSPRSMMRQNDALYRMWLSGRKNTDGVLVELNLNRRFCALQTALSFGRAQDICSYTVEFGDDELDNVVLLIYFDKRVPRKTMAKRLTDYQDLAQFCREVKSAKENWRVFTELGEVAEMVQSDTRVHSMASRNLLRMLHVSDRFQKGQKETGVQQSYSKRMYLEFNLSCVQQDDLDCLKFVMYLIDRLSQYKLTRDAKQRALKNRHLADEQNRKAESKHRQELAKQRREERLREEKRKVENDPELLRRLEEKQHKKEVRRKQQKTKQVLVKSF